MIFPLVAFSNEPHVLKCIFQQSSMRGMEKPGHNLRRVKGFFEVITLRGLEVEARLDDIKIQQCLPQFM